MATPITTTLVRVGLYQPHAFHTTHISPAVDDTTAITQTRAALQGNLHAEYIRNCIDLGNFEVVQIVTTR